MNRRQLEPSKQLRIADEFRGHQIGRAYSSRAAFGRGQHEKLTPLSCNN